MRSRNPLALAAVMALALAVTACGTTSAGAPGAGGSSSPSPASSGAAGEVTVTAADSGRTVVLSRGQILVVELASQGMLTWDRPRLTNAVPGAVRELSASGGYPSHATMVARFLAVLPGSATLSSKTDARCLHVAPRCAFPQRPWLITVIVRG